VSIEEWKNKYCSGINADRSGDAVRLHLAYLWK